MEKEDVENQCFPADNGRRIGSDGEREKIFRGGIINDLLCNFGPWTLNLSIFL